MATNRPTGAKLATPPLVRMQAFLKRLGAITLPTDLQKKTLKIFHDTISSEL